MPDQRPNATLLTKEKGRRQQILAMRCRMPGMPTTTPLPTAWATEP
jgi:hypothetical protein